MSGVITNFYINIDQEIATKLNWLGNISNNEIKINTTYQAINFGVTWFMSVFDKSGQAMLWKISSDFNIIQFYWGIDELVKKGFENGCLRVRENHFQVIRTVFRWLLLFSSRLIAKLRQARHRILNRKNKHLFLCALKTDHENFLTRLSGLDSAKRIIHEYV